MIGQKYQWSDTLCYFPETIITVVSVGLLTCRHVLPIQPSTRQNLLSFSFGSTRLRTTRVTPSIIGRDNGFFDNKPGWSGFFPFETLIKDASWLLKGNYPLFIKKLLCWKFRYIPTVIAAKYEKIIIVDFFSQHLSYLLEGKSYLMVAREGDYIHSMVDYGRKSFFASDNRGRDLASFARTCCQRRRNAVSVLLMAG